MAEVNESKNMKFIEYCQRNLTHDKMKELYNTPENSKAFEIWGTPICKECRLVMERKYGMKGQHYGQIA